MQTVEKILQCRMRCECKCTWTLLHHPTPPRHQKLLKRTYGFPAASILIKTDIRWVNTSIRGLRASIIEALLLGTLHSWAPHALCCREVALVSQWLLGRFYGWGPQIKGFSKKGRPNTTHQIGLILPLKSCFLDGFAGPEVWEPPKVDTSSN